MKQVVPSELNRQTIIELAKYSPIVHGAYSAHLAGYLTFEQCLIIIAVWSAEYIDELQKIATEGLTTSLPNQDYPRGPKEGKMIDGVILKYLIRHVDQRGYFQEIIRSTDDFFAGFGQWSLSFMHQGTIKAWHIHQVQYDYWLVVSGVVLAAVCDQRPGSLFYGEVNEFVLGDNQPPAVLCIPPGVAHGCKVLQGPAHLLYITSETYNPADEGRIPFDALGYDWFKQEIK